MKKRLIIFGAILLGLYARRITRTRLVGWTLFKATGVQDELTHIDIEQQQAIGIVTYKSQIHMTVMLDLKEDVITVEGSVENLKDAGMDQDTYIDMFKQQAEFFIENKVSDPNMYYANLLAQQKTGS